MPDEALLAEELRKARNEIDLLNRRITRMGNRYSSLIGHIYKKTPEQDIMADTDDECKKKEEGLSHEEKSARVEAAGGVICELATIIKDAVMGYFDDCDGISYSVIFAAMQTAKNGLLCTSLHHFQQQQQAADELRGLVSTLSEVLTEKKKGEEKKSEE